MRNGFYLSLFQPKRHAPRAGKQVVKSVRRVHPLSHQRKIRLSTVQPKPAARRFVGVNDTPAFSGHQHGFVALAQVQRHDRTQRPHLLGAGATLGLAHQCIQPGEKHQAGHDEINFNHRSPAASSLNSSAHNLERCRKRQARSPLRTQTRADRYHSVSTGGSSVAETPRRRPSAANSVISRMSAN